MRTRIMKQRQAFSLVELLVVIFIIAALLSLLFPAFSQAMRKSKAVICGSNVKQLYIAHHLFAANNKGNPIPFDTTYTAYNMNDGYGHTTSPGGPGFVKDQTKRIINKYLEVSLTPESALKVVDCPVDPNVGNKLAGGTSYYTNTGYVDSSFGSGQTLSGNLVWNRYPTKSLSWIPKPNPDEEGLTHGKLFVSKDKNAT
jgi:prepilin-type N-terminal cleavage/methylation domain-containing protein